MIKPVLITLASAVFAIMPGAAMATPGAGDAAQAPSAAPAPAQAQTKYCVVDEPESGLWRERGCDAGRDQRGGPSGGQLAAGAKAVEEKEERQAVKRHAQPVGRPGQQQGVQAID